MTNLQIIQNMSEDEIGRFLMNPESIDIPFCKNLSECMINLDEGKDIPEEKCFKCMIEWLRKEKE